MRGLVVLALILAAVAGGVDAVGWLMLGGIFVAHMSGNTVGMTTHIALGEWAEVVRRAFVVLAFALGLAFGAAASALAAHRSPRLGFTIALGFEAVLLASVLALGVAARGPYYLLVAMSAGAMGVQSATLRRVGATRARTTYVTGVLTRLVEALVQLVMRGDDEKRANARERVRLLAGVWLAYAAGGVAAGLLAVRVGFAALVLPLALVLLASALDWGLVRAGVEDAGPDET